MYLSEFLIKSGAFVLILLLVCFITLVRPLPGKHLLEADGSGSGKMQDVHPLPYLPGIDVSFYQGKVDWQKIKTGGIHFVYLKATEGITYTDPMFHRNQDQLLKEGLSYGVYHFFEPKDDGEKQADNFLTQVKLHGELLPPVVDVEVSRGMDKKILQERLKIWLETVESRTGCRPIIYSYGSFYETYLGEEFLAYPLWLADYAEHPHLPNGLARWTMWQHSQRGQVEGIDSMVDMDWFPGDLAQLRSMRCNAGGGK